MKLSVKIIVSNLITIMIFLVICVIVFLTLGQLKENQFWVNHTYNVIRDGETLLSNMVDQETGMRGFLVTGQDDYLEPYVNGKESFHSLMAELSETVNDNPEQVARLNAIKGMALDWDEKAASVFIAIRREIVEQEKYKGLITQRMNDGTGKRMMDNFRSLLDPYLERESANRILSDMINMETGLRGYIASENETFLEPYYNGKLSIDENLDDLGISRISSAAMEWINNYAEIQISDLVTANKYQNREDLNSILSKNIGKQYMDGIRLEIAGFIEMESKLLVVRNEAADNQRFLTNILIIVGSIIATIVALILSLLLTRSITKQIGGEPGEISGMVQQVAAGDLGIKFDQRNAVGVYLFMKQMVSSLDKIIRDVLVGTEQISSASEQLASGNQDLSNRTEQQASSLEETSSAIEEMNTSIKSNADNTGAADKLSRAAVDKSEEGSRTIADMVSSMDEISVSSNRIADIIEVITNIAFQTNLLALNASIEAARAGEQGKGFAVVAVEVRKLAKRSDKAANEITEIIRNSNQKVTEGVEIANKAGVVLNEINDAVKKVTTLVGEISASSQEQLSSADEIDKTLTNLDENTQKNAALVEEAASATEELSAQAQQLYTTLQFFKLKDIKENTQGKLLANKKNLSNANKKQVFLEANENKSSVSQADEKYEAFGDLVDEGQFDEF